MSWNFLASYKKSLPTGKQNKQIAFGLVELMVSISIMTIVAGVVLARQSAFNSALLLRSEAYEIALTAREVQLSSVSVTSTGSNDPVLNFRSIMGLYFSTADGFDGTYPVFRDSNTVGNKFFYDSDERFGAPSRLDSRFEIRKIVVGGATHSELSIIYARPNFDPIFFTDRLGTASTANTVEIHVYLRNNVTDTCGKDYRIVEFTRAGQITVKDC